MSYFYLLSQCIIIGFIIAAPIGAVGILCINHALHHGFKAAFITGLGAALGDTVFGGLATFGITSVASFFTAEQSWIRLIAGAIIFVVGYNTFKKSPLEQHPDLPKQGHARYFFTSIAMTLANPITIVAFIGIFAATGSMDLLVELRYWQILLLVAAIFFGAASWWLLLSFIISHFRHKFNRRGLLRINQLFGALLLILGVWFIILGGFFS